MVPGAQEEDLDAMLERLLLDDEVEQAGSYSVMVPGPPDEAALEATIARLMLGDDPPSELLVVAGDAQARAVGELVALAHPGLVQVVAEEELFDTTIREATVPWRAVAYVLTGAAAVAAFAAAAQVVSFVYLLYIGVSLVLGAIAWTTLVWMLYAWRTPASLADSGLGRQDLACALSFSLIVPARHEEAVL